MAHTLVWVDIPVQNLERAMQFYSKILNVDLSQEEYNGMKFSLLPNKENEVSGCIVEDKSMSTSKTGPLIYLNTDKRLTEATKLAEQNGGEVIINQEQIGKWGYRSVIIDSEGNKIALHSFVL